MSLETLHMNDNVSENTNRAFKFEMSLKTPIINMILKEILNMLLKDFTCSLTYTLIVIVPNHVLETVWFL